jgi:hypothetical protein
MPASPELDAQVGGWDAHRGIIAGWESSLQTSLCAEAFHVTELRTVMVRIETQAFSSIREAGRVSNSTVKCLESKLCEGSLGKHRVG